MQPEINIEICLEVNSNQCTFEFLNYYDEDKLCLTLNPNDYETQLNPSYYFHLTKKLLTFRQYCRIQIRYSMNKSPP